MTDPNCPITGTPMARGTKKLTLSYKGESMTFDMPGWYSLSSEEGIHSGEDMKVSDRVLNRLKARVEGLLEPEEIRRIRKRLRLSQSLAGELIGGGPRAFQKYESGDLLPSRAISSALILLDAQPNALKVLEARTASVGRARTPKAGGQIAKANPLKHVLGGATQKNAADSLSPSPSPSGSSSSFS